MSILETVYLLTRLVCECAAIIVYSYRKHELSSFVHFYILITPKDLYGNSLKGIERILDGNRFAGPSVVYPGVTFYSSQKSAKCFHTPILSKKFRTIL